MRVRHAFFIFFFLLAACAPTGAIVARDAGIAAASPHGRGALLLDVPFFPQPEGLCGPASLASVLHYWKEEISVKEIAQAVYLPGLKGTLGIDLTLFARGKGFRADAFSGTLPRLRERLAEGIPMIAFLNLGNRFFPAGHFIVVTGIDEDREEVIAHSGAEADKPIPYQTFLAAWEKSGSWTLEVAPAADPL